MRPQPTATVSAAVPAAIAAARYRLTTTRYTTNTSGVSLIPAAIPTRTPDHGFDSHATRSTSTNAIRIRLIWPNPNVCSTGSEKNTTTAATDTIVTSSRLGVRPCARSRTTLQLTHIAQSERNVWITVAAWID